MTAAVANRSGPTLYRLRVLVAIIVSSGYWSRKIFCVSGITKDRFPKQTWLSMKGSSFRFVIQSEEIKISFRIAG